jgi:AcrR family transcriptional regulator
MIRRTKRAQPRNYHHGDLKAALLKGAEAILEKEGVPGLTLRAIARRTGVSHAAPNNHFGDLTGLLSELAAVGFVRFNAVVGEAMTASGKWPRDRRMAMGRAYVGFARQRPGLFALMFRGELLDPTRPALRDAIAGARLALRDAAAAGAPIKPLTPLQLAAQSAALWSLAHGFATLLLDGRLDGMIKALPGEEDADSLLEAVLAVARVGDAPFSRMREKVARRRRDG